MRHAILRFSLVLTALSSSTPLPAPSPDKSALQVTDNRYLDQQGLPVFVDQKVSAMEINPPGNRIATNGEVRLLPTPEHWDAVPKFARRVLDAANRRLTAFCSSPAYDVSYRLEVSAEGDGLRDTIYLDKPLPASLTGVAGFKGEFLPSAYSGKTFLLAAASGIFPRHPGRGMKKDRAAGPVTRGSVAFDGPPLALYDGRLLPRTGGSSCACGPTD